MTRIASALLLLGIALTEPLTAQGTIAIPGARVGDLVRVESPAIRSTKSVRVVGVLQQANQGFVKVAIGDRRDASVVVPWARITSVDLTGPRRRLERAGRGALVGLGTAVLVAPPMWNQRVTGFEHLEMGVTALVGLPIAGAVGGWFTAPRRWEMSDWRPAIDSVLPEGEAVRLTLPVNQYVLVRLNRKTIGGRVASSGDSLVLRGQFGLLTFPWDSVSELSMQGHRDRSRGAAIGITLLGAYSTFYVSRTEGGASPAAFVLGHMALGGLVGAAIGTRGWDRMPIPER